ncbi:MAG: hypothetical protein DMD31_17040 [Gemmatimonadetes bacterium]|nr:MAG: hypothetical protein DMD31_17040 [Gemmatimonadota bacterium]
MGGRPNRSPGTVPYGIPRARTDAGELDDHFYSFSGTAFTTPPDYSLGVVAGNYHSSPQHDLVVSLGLAVTPLGRGKSAP